MYDEAQLEARHGRQNQRNVGRGAADQRRVHAASAEMRRDILLAMNTGAANQISKTLNKKQP
jgi:hypothetical protein